MPLESRQRVQAAKNARTIDCLWALSLRMACHLISVAVSMMIWTSHPSSHALGSRQRPLSTRSLPCGARRAILP
ncbi:hypothetical protein HETIRDRAFT_319641 [Heterobasidion irregulare TC 32-1]|uniref:Uncharacterized protein n=1 Tax=Heterobasidion irregulare (strain TC 32-1) TaxID=747525 RepID=W4K5Q1_HETIT|nr:uncharacterized protein HETIRDRAFT_319641 [Heterobasidion irregulare TC 32-1]ETW81148.1 hypothetical protein HETIRDRAFT_319641 [Heterobasidion irregulare TC 32-1]